MLNKHTKKFNVRKINQNFFFFNVSLMVNGMEEKTDLEARFS